MNLLLLASFGEVMNYVGYVLVAILVLLVMITVHEFGHYVSGKLLGFGIEEFAIGFGPKLLWKKKKNGEIFSVRALPLGGFCAFKGEDQDSDDPTAFNNKKPWQRIIVLVSGALMNYLLALLIIVTMFSCYGQTALMTYKLNNEAVQSEYSFVERDVILKADGKNVYLTTDLMNVLSGKKEGDLVDFSVRRDGKKQNVQIKLLSDANFENVEDMTALFDALGIYYESGADGEIINAGLYATGIRFGVFDTLIRSFEYSFKLAGTIFVVLKQLITGALGIGSLGGTVTTIAVTADAIKVGGLRHLLNISSFIGVNLAVFNLLPFPALDGSRVVFTGIEWARGKPLNRRIEGMIHTVGFLLILLFALFVDLQQCF